LGIFDFLPAMVALIRQQEANAMRVYAPILEVCLPCSERQSTVSN